VTFKFPRYSGFPIELLSLGHWAQMSGGAKGLYIVLCGASDRRSSRRFELKDEDVVKMAGVSRGTLNAARKELSEMGMVVCDREPGGRFTYTLCNPKTGRPFPGDPRAKVAYDDEESSSATADADDETPTAPPDVPAAIIAPTVSTKATDVPPESIGDACEDGLEFCDTSFEFGWNVTPQPNVCDYNPFSDNRRGAVLV
jgi:hypothetical protein